MPGINYNGIPRIPVQSSNIKSAGYDPITKIMVVEFHNGGTYAYHNVPMDVYDDFRTADSCGRYFASNIRNAYETVKVV